MFAVGKLGSYISKGVSTVSGTFQPFGGAVDIVVVEQPDGTFKSSPWYVRFGKFQGVLKASEKVVSITVNGVEADFNMFLDHKGDAFFLREVEVDEGEFDPYVSSGDEMDVNAELWTVRKSKSCNFDANGKDFVSELETNNGKSNSRRGKLFGFSLGRRPAKGKGFEGTTDSHVVERANSVECAKLAADLLEVRWTTNSRARDKDGHKLPPSRSKVKVVGEVADKDGHKLNDSFFYGDDPDKVYSSISNEGINKVVDKVPTSMNTQNHDKAENTLYTPSHSASTCDSDTSDKSNTSENLIHEDDVMEKFDAKAFSSISPSNDSEDEQFSFSDLDDQNVDKGLEPELSSFRREKGLSQDCSERSDNTVSETCVSDDKLHQVLCKFDQGDNVHSSSQGNSNTMSNPINIVKLPITESMPNMLEGVGVSSYSCPERLGHSLDSNLESIKIFNDMLGTSKGNSTQQQVERIHLETIDSHISKDIRKIIANPSVELSLCRHLLYEGMGYEAAAVAFDAQKLDIDEEISLNPEISKNDKLVLRIGGLYFPSDAACFISPVTDALEKEKIMEPEGMIVVGQVGDGKSSEEMTQILMNSQSGPWKIWPFLFKRSNGIQKKSVSSEPHFRNSSGTTEWMDSGRPKVAKRKIRTKAPISEQLASLKLKDGKNEVTFTFSSAMLGKQQVDARIFLWKWNTRIVISDVDGTITKSDVLGQFMPLMGMDWSQTGVTHLFSAIKENGYQLLFLSARSISQAYYTRQFLFNLKQGEKELPEGPIIISPDGLFPSLYREVIRRAPHEFKISCLEDIKVLFPPDHSPFYAGFGNRDTDEISYLRVGIPIGKIFIINPKGQIAVNRRVDTKSYMSLHSLVHGMFPPAPPSEKEDYNSWNFWRLPPPDVI